MNALDEAVGLEEEPFATARPDHGAIVAGSGNDSGSLGQGSDESRHEGLLAQFSDGFAASIAPVHRFRNLPVRAST
jgi:hypothetical protein